MIFGIIPSVHATFSPLCLEYVCMYVCSSQRVLFFTGKTQLSVILCLASEDNSLLNSLPQDVQELSDSYQLSPFVTKVGYYSFLSPPLIRCIYSLLIAFKNGQD